MMINWSFSYNSFVKFHGKNLGASTLLCYIQIHVISRCIIKGLHCNRTYLFAMFDVSKKR